MKGEQQTNRGKQVVDVTDDVAVESQAQIEMDQTTRERELKRVNTVDVPVPQVKEEEVETLTPQMTPERESERIDVPVLRVME